MNKEQIKIGEVYGLKEFKEVRTQYNTNQVLLVKVIKILKDDMIVVDTMPLSSKDIMKVSELQTVKECHDELNMIHGALFSQLPKDMSKDSIINILKKYVLEDDEEENNYITPTLFAFGYRPTISNSKVIKECIPFKQDIDNTFLGQRLSYLYQLQNFIDTNDEYKDLQLFKQENNSSITKKSLSEITGSIIGDPHNDFLITIDKANSNKEDKLLKYKKVLSHIYDKDGETEIDTTHITEEELLCVKKYFNKLYNCYNILKKENLLTEDIKNLLLKVPDFTEANYVDELKDGKDRLKELTDMIIKDNNK
jgi:hypothetical protein